MKSQPHTFAAEIETLQQMLSAQQADFAEKEADYQALLQEWEAKYQALLEQFRLAQHKRFGASSEANPAQGMLFNEAELEAPQDEDAEQETISYTRKKRKGRPSLPADLPREQVLLDIADEDKVCECCGGERHCIGEERSEKLEFIPAQLKVLEHVRPKYACRHCEREGTEVIIKIAPPTPSLIPKSIATPSLLAQIVSAKFHYALPLYRQESLFKQFGIELSRKTMSSWMLKCAAGVETLLALLKQQLLAQGVIHADETTLKVIEDERSKSYVWVYCCGSDSDGDKETPGIVLFDYQQGSRSGQCPAGFLQGFSGYLQVDGYEAYEQTKATLVGCMAHARRKFKDAEKALPKSAKGKGGKIQWAINQLQKLYRIEKKLRGKSAEEVYAVRQVEAKALLEQFKVWLDSSVLQVPPKSLLGKAISYTLNQWSKLTRYLDDGRLSIDNNRAERAVKPFTIGRKNWLFANSHNGAEASAALYSLVETAKANGLQPFDYLAYIFEELPKLKEGDCHAHLLPWNMLPAEPPDSS